MSSYEPLYTPTFLACLRGSDKKQRVEKFVQRICDDPYYRSKLLSKKRKIDLRGKRSRHLTGNFVLVYIICKECIENNFKEKHNNCSDCPNDTERVIFLAFGKHDDIYSRQWGA